MLLCFQELEVTDDTVLERHTEDPATVQIRLLGQGGTYPALTSAQSCWAAAGVKRRSYETAQKCVEE